MSQGAFDDLVTSIARQSLRIVDNIGITVNMRELPSWQRYQELKGAVYGSGLLSRIWAQILRPWLRPVAHAELWAQWDTVERELHEELIWATIEKTQPATHEETAHEHRP